MNVFDLFAKINLDSSEYEKGLDEAGKKTSMFGEVLKANLASAAITKGLELATKAVSGLATALPSAISSLASYGDNIDKMSQKMGLSAEAYQEWDAVMQHSGTSIESMKASMRTLAVAAEKGNEAFTKLGLSQEQVSSMSQEELFSATITALQNVSDETERTYLASQLLGRGATELGPLLNTSAEDTQRMKDRVHELNGVMSDESVKAAARYQDSLQDMQTAIGGVKRSLVEGFLPAAADVMDGLTDIISGADVEGGLKKFDEGINRFFENLDAVIPRVVEILDKILPIVAEKLPVLLEKILPIVIEILTQLFVALVKALPVIIRSLIEAAPDIVKALGQALMESAPILLEAAAELIAFILTGLMEGLAKLVQLGAELVTALAQGIKNKISAIVDRVREIGDSIKNGILDLINRAKQWGADLLQNFINGIVSKISALWDRVKSIGQGIKDFLGFSEPKKGPLSNFHTFAPDMMQLFAQGIKDNEHLVTDQIAKSFDFGAVGVGTPGGYGPGRVTTVERRPGTAAGSVINVVLELDRQQLGRVVYQLNEQETQRVGVKLARGYA